MNIILISIDALRHDYLGFTGNEDVKTPNIDTLAENGMVFRTAISQASYTLPSHTSMLSGLYPFKHGLRRRKDWTSPENPDETLIFSQLKKHGYNVNSLLGEGIGYFDFLFNSEWEQCNKSGYSRMKNVRKVLKKNRNDKFFLFIHYWGVHHPYESYLPFGNKKEFLINLATFLETHGFKTKWQKRILKEYSQHRILRIRDMMLTGGKYIKKVKKGYRRSVYLMDKFIGKIVRYLKKLKIFGNTLIILTADHGESFSEHNERKVTDVYEHGSFLYDYLIRVPLIFHLPSALPRQEFDNLVESIDIVPTIYDLLNITPENEDSLDGKSLINLLKDREYSRKYAYSETEEYDWVSLRSKNYHLIERLSDGSQKQLYDLNEDPGEYNNLYRKNNKIFMEMENYLENLFGNYPRYRKLSDIPKADDEELAEMRKRLEQLGYL